MAPSRPALARPKCVAAASVSRESAGEPDYALRLCCSHDATRLAVATSAPDVAIVDAETCVPLTRLQPKQPGSITDVSFSDASSPDVVFASSSGGMVTSWDTRSNGKPSLWLAPRKQEIWSFAIGGDQGTLLAAGAGSELILWDLRQSSNQRLAVWDEAHTEDITVVRFHPLRRSSLFTASEDCLVCHFSLGSIGQSASSVLPQQEAQWLAGDSSPPSKRPRHDTNGSSKAGSSSKGRNGNSSSAQPPPPPPPPPAAAAAALGDMEEYLEGTLNSEQTVAQLCFFGRDLRYLCCRSTVESISLWDAWSGDRLASWDDLRPLLSEQKVLSEEAQYLVSCEYTSANDRLQVTAGTNYGQFATFPVLPVCGRKGSSGAETTIGTGAGGDMEVEEEGEISRWTIGPATSVFDGKHSDVVRDMVSRSSEGSGRGNVSHSHVWSCGEDGMVCRWMVDA